MVKKHRAFRPAGEPTAGVSDGEKRTVLFLLPPPLCMLSLFFFFDSPFATRHPRRFLQESERERERTAVAMEAGGCIGVIENPIPVSRAWSKDLG